MTTNGRDSQLGVEMHGVRLNLACNNEELLLYVKALLNSAAGAPWDAPDLAVSGTWRAEPPDGGTAFPDAAQLDRFGKRMDLAADDLVWFDTHRDKGLQLRFRRIHGVLTFDVDYCYRPSAKKLARDPDYEQRKFFFLMRYLVHFPIAWFLERTYGWALLHASAVAFDDRAVLVAGPGGAGKTTTCVALVALAGMSLVTENLLFFNGHHIFPVSEPIRLTEDSLALLGDARGGLEPLGLNGLKQKAMFKLPVHSGTLIEPAAVFVPQFSQQSFVRRIPAVVASEILGASNRLTLELNDYYWYTAALDLLWPEAGNAERQVRTLSRLADQTPCYTLGIDRSAGVQPVVDRILECVGLSHPMLGGVVS